jgi:hypothetical protein
LNMNKLMIFWKRIYVGWIYATVGWVADIRLLQASLTDDTTDNKRTIKRQTKCQPFAKLKELQADTQANAFAAHLILPNSTQSPPTTRPVDIGQLDGNF